MYDFEATLAILLQNPATPDGVSEAIAQLRGDQEKANPEEGKGGGSRFKGGGRVSSKRDQLRPGDRRR